MVAKREVSSRELLDLYVGRIERLNPAVNAVVTLDVERAREEAAAADQASSKPGAGAVAGSLGPLHGLPITVKDAIEVAGLRSTGGAEALSGHIPMADAPVVARVRAAGAIVVGKTNVPEWSGDFQTFNALFGTTNNPWDLSRTPGGSSGGPAAAVATGLTSFEIGTDIGGSIRVPSNFCGVCGHKPSFGVVSQRGYLDRVGGGVTDADINVFGPIARSVGDLSLLLDVLSGPDAEDAVAWSLALPPARHSSLSDYRVGLWLDDPFSPVESSVVDLLSTAASALAGAGAKVSEARPPLEMASVRALFDQLLIPAISVSFEPELGTALGGNHRDWLDAGRQQAAMRQVWASWFKDFDALLCPVAPTLPFPHDQERSVPDRFVIINGKSRPQSDILSWTGLAGVSYLPATVVPVGRVGDLPVGAQIIGPYLEDRTPLFVGAQLTDLLGGFEAPPLAGRPS